MAAIGLGDMPSLALQATFARAASLSIVPA
jgi:hypothetical protein